MLYFLGFISSFTGNKQGQNIDIEPGWQKVLFGFLHFKDQIMLWPTD